MSQYRFLLCLCSWGNVFLLVLCGAQANAQSVERYVTANGSSYAGTATIMIESNIGELMVNSFTNPSGAFTQGFVQPETDISTGLPDVDTLVSALVYPNPCTDKLYIELGQSSWQGISMDVFDLLGQKQPVIMTDNSGGKTKQVTLENIPSGVYFLKISVAGIAGSKTYKINKL